MNLLKFNDAKDKLQTILAQEEYQAYHQEHQTIWTRILDKLKDLLSPLIESLSTKLKISHTTSTAILFIVIGFLILIVAGFIIWTLFHFTRKSKNRIHAVGTAGELTRSMTYHLEKSQEAFNNGDTTMAVRYAFLAFISELDKAGWIQARAWKTNQEYYMELIKKDMKQAQAFQEIAQFFDHTIYGGEKVSTDEYAHYRRSIIQLIDQLKTSQNREGAS